jgi:large subunit ribosomal protein L17
MRHRVAGKRLSRDSEHRVAMRRNIAASLFEHETISTTIQKAKDVKPFAEKLITLAKKGTLAARRRAIALLGERDIVKDEEGEAVKTSTVIRKLFSDIGPRYLDRPGGYTRIIRLSLRRLGDNGELCLLQLVGSEEKMEKEPKAAKKSRKEAEAEETQPQEVAEAEQPAETEQEAEPEAEEIGAESEPEQNSNENAKQAGQPEEKEDKKKNKEDKRK